MGRKGESITLSLKDYEKQVLEELAREYGMMWGNRPNISKLLKAIAKRELLVAANHDWSKEKVKELDTIRNILVDFGKIEEAKLIAQILCDRSEISDPLKKEIEEFIAHPLPVWRQQIDSYIKRQQPFKLVYQDACNRIWQYTVVYARIQQIEKRSYLLCRCQETKENLDIEELRHNWNLRLDRIQEAEIIPINCNWYNNLQQVTVEFHLFGNLAIGSSYSAKVEDVSIQIETNDDGLVYKKVVRNIFSTFWFFREIAKYWQNCLIISPENIREKFIIEKLQSLNSIYEH